MSESRYSAAALAWPSLHHAKGLLLGLPFVATAVAPGIVYGAASCAAALLLTAMANFLVFLPLTVLALNRGEALAEEAPAPALTARAYVALLVLWSATAWGAAALAAHLP